MDNMNENGQNGGESVACVEQGKLTVVNDNLPACIIAAGPQGHAAWEEFFFAELNNVHTKKAYRHAVLRFLAWWEPSGLELKQALPGHIGRFLDTIDGSPALRNQTLSALRGFFACLAKWHVVVLNPAASVKGIREQIIEGKTPQIAVSQAKALLKSIAADTSIVGIRDHAIVATLAYTAARVGAVARLRLGDLRHDGTQSALRFREKGNKARAIPVRHDLERILGGYLDEARLREEPKEAPLFRASDGHSQLLTERPLKPELIGRMLKRRLKAAGLPGHLSAHSFRVTAVTALLEQGVPLDEVQHLAGHSDPRTTRLYDRRQMQVSRNIVERIPI